MAGPGVLPLKASRGIAVAVTLAAAAAIWVTAASMPAHVAARFSFGGFAAGWNSRDLYRGMMVACTLVGPLSVYLFAGRLPRRFWPFMLAPGRAYWFGDAHRVATLDWIEAYAALNAAVVALFLLGLHVVILNANLLDPPRLEMGPALLLLMAWFAYLVIAAVVFARRLRPTRRRHRDDPELTL